VIGIMAAVAVPKFFDINTNAHTANKQAVIGNIKTGLNNYAAQQLASEGSRLFPTGLTIASLLDEVPDNWTTPSASVLSYSGDATSYSYTTGSSNTAYTLQ